MKPHQERVVVERDELQEKITKLGAFFDTKVYKELDENEQIRLSSQIEFMQAYCNVLNARIAAFA